MDCALCQLTLVAWFESVCPITIEDIYANEFIPELFAHLQECLTCQAYVAGYADGVAWARAYNVPLLPPRPHPLTYN